MIEKGQKDKKASELEGGIVNENVIAKEMQK